MNIMYFHSGSGNHGCEAIVRTIIDICNIKDNILYAFQDWEDYKFELDKITRIKKSYLNTSELEENYAKKTIAMSIGGDNYCYVGQPHALAIYNQKFNEKDVKTALIGCSINNPDEIVEDLKKYSLITTRESITHERLNELGIKNYLIPDSAFVLSKEDVNFDDQGKEWIGINASSIIDNPTTKANYKSLIQHILRNTNYNIMLIPHVVQSFNDDLKFLNELYIDNGRMKLIEDCNCMQLKGYINKCKMVICTRTHCSIASYSQNIPTLVLGYSIKSKGIAKDIFGTDKNYVIDINDLKNDDDLINAFKWLENEYLNIKQHLEEFIPKYIERCYELRGLYESLRSQE